MMDWTEIDPNKHLQIPGTVKPTSKNAQIVAKKRRKTKGNSPAGLDPDQVLELIQRRVTNSPLTQGVAGRRHSLKRARDTVTEYRKFLTDLDATHFLTFMPGRLVRPEAIALNIKKFCNRIERMALGKRWMKFVVDRIRLVGFLEKPDITPHYHALAFVPDIIRPYLTKYGSEIWTTLIPAGKLDCQLITDTEEVVSYVTKDLHHGAADENVVIYAPIRR